MDGVAKIAAVCWPAIKGLEFKVCFGFLEKVQSLFLYGRLNGVRIRATYHV